LRFKSKPLKKAQDSPHCYQNLSRESFAAKAQGKTGTSRFDAQFPGRVVVSQLFMPCRPAGILSQ
jgi:hypothetical protein